jgi:drug/metabolite transporter (DMT)-like permease
MTVPPADATNAQPLIRSAQFRAYAALGLGIFATSFNGIFVQLANTNGFVVGFYRLGIGWLILCIPMLIGWRRGTLQFPGDKVHLGILAGVASAADFGMWNTAVILIGAGMSTVLGNTAPIWVAMGAWIIFREKLRPIYWVGLAIALTGALLIVGVDALQGLNTGFGNLLGLGTGVAYGAYQLITHRARTYFDTLSYMWIYYFIGASILLGLSLATGQRILGLANSTYAALIGMALFSGLGGWLLVNYSFAFFKPSLITVTLLAQPVLTTILEVSIFQHTPQPWQIAGGLVTLFGVYMVHRSSTSEDSAISEPVTIGES